VSAGLVLALTSTAACGADDPVDSSAEETPTDDASSTPAEPSDSPTTAEPPVTTLVYYLADDPRGVRLAREPHELPTEGTAEAALAAMIAGPDDPDYATTWNPDTEVLGVEQDGKVITVDLSEEALGSEVGRDAAQRMAQQLVYTVTEVLGETSTVQLLIEGEEPDDGLWGEVSWTEPVPREDPMVVRNLVQIDTPAEGGTSGRRLTVSGEAATFEATVPWRVFDGTGAVVRKGFTTAAEGMTLSPYSFTVRLEPGTYTVEVSEDDPSGGEGDPPRTDTRTVSVG